MLAHGHSLYLFIIGRTLNTSQHVVLYERGQILPAGGGEEFGGRNADENQAFDLIGDDQQFV